MIPKKECGTAAPAVAQQKWRKFEKNESLVFAYKLKPKPDGVDERLAFAAVKGESYQYLTHKSNPVVLATQDKRFVSCEPANRNVYTHFSHVVDSAEHLEQSTFCRRMTEFCFAIFLQVNVLFWLVRG